MKKILYIGLILLLVFLSIIRVYPNTDDPYKNKKEKLFLPTYLNAIQVKEGQTVQQVEKLLGAPQESFGSGFLRKVYYLEGGGCILIRFEKDVVKIVNFIPFTEDYANIKHAIARYFMLIVFSYVCTGVVAVCVLVIKKWKERSV